MRRPMQAAAGTCRIAFGPRTGQKVLTLQGAMPREKDFKQSLCADIDGFSLHAAVRCAADDRQALEQLCRYITRPALANEGVQTNAAGQVVLKLKATAAPNPFGVCVISLREVSGPPLREPWRAGTLIYNFGQAARPGSAARARVHKSQSPQEPEPPTQATPPVECEARCAHHRPVRPSWAKLLQAGVRDRR